MAWKNFQNGYPLYASELNNYLMNQAVVVFASAAERDSVLTSPVEGQVVWLQDTNAFKIYNGTAWTDINDNTDAIQKSLLTTQGDLIVASGSSTPARLGIGTSGQVLTSNGTTATWQSTSSGSMTQLATGSYDGTTAINISSISQGYRKLRLVSSNIYSSDSSYASVSVKFNDDTSSNYYQGVSNAEIYDASFNIYGLPLGTVATGKYSFAYLEFENYTATSALKLINGQYGFERPSGVLVASINQGYYRGTSAITKMNIAPSANLRGTYTLFGVN